jgi:paraquat-inducible protein B
LDTPSFVSMLVGGVSFETPASFAVPEDVPEGKIFNLYPNKQATRQTRYFLKSRYVLNFDESVAGLVPGSSVEFQGIKIGEVLNVKLELDSASTQLRIPVVIEIEPERLGISGQIEAADRTQLIEDLVGKGMRARLKTSNLVTGRKSIDFALLDDVEPAHIRVGDQYPELPTAGGSFDAITSRVARIVDRVDQVPIESIGENLDRVLVALRDTLGEVKNLAGAANAEIMPSLATSLESLEATLESADTIISPDSPIPREFERLVVDLAEAARSLRILAERLEAHPEELLQGKAK